MKLYQPLDIRDQRFGMLRAIRPTTERKNRGVVWELACDCGSPFYEIVKQLTSGRKTNCGCVRPRNVSVKNWEPLPDVEETDEQAYAIAEQSEKLSQLGAALRRANAMVAHMKFKIR